MSIFLCGSFRSSAITRKKTATTRGEAERDALQHGPRACLERQRLEEEHRLESLAVDAREPERDEPERPGRRRARARAREDRLLLAVELLRGSPASRPGGRTS